ncbi:MAG: hypothetical protein HY520_01355 [Candidatus Aenigmarchaeota archaeon]|nr:hypothetical protein [Candidatus Aenigmarchaeota archaeon]
MVATDLGSSGDFLDRARELGVQIEHAEEEGTTRMRALSLALDRSPRVVAWTTPEYAGIYTGVKVVPGTADIPQCATMLAGPIQTAPTQAACILPFRSGKSGSSFPETRQQTDIICLRNVEEKLGYALDVFGPEFFHPEALRASMEAYESFRTARGLPKTLDGTKLLPIIAHASGAGVGDIMVDFQYPDELRRQDEKDRFYDARRLRQASQFLDALEAADLYFGLAQKRRELPVRANGAGDRSASARSAGSGTGK